MAELPLDPAVFVYGHLDRLLHLLDSLGKSETLLSSYPESLQHLLHRRVWRGRVSDLAQGPAAAQRPLFVKVAHVSDRVRPLSFASQVVGDFANVATHFATSPDRIILCAEPVDWRCEWRVYVRNHRVQGMFLVRPEIADPAELRPEHMIDTRIADHAVDCLRKSSEATAAYALDFGVLSTGQTALVEANDAVALVNYGLPHVRHLALHMVRWRELMS